MTRTLSTLRTPRPAPRLRAALGLTASLFLSLVVLLGAPAARAGEDDVQLQVRDQVPAGEKPAVRVTAQKQDVEELEIRLRRDDGRKVKLTTSIAAGEVKELTWSQDTGTHKYKGEATVRYAGGKEQSLSMDFSVTVAGDVAIRVVGFNLDKKLVRFESKGRLAKAELEVKDAEGKSLGKVERKLGLPSERGMYEATWEAEAGTVAKVVVTGYDVTNAWARVEVIPFAIFIPHDEVVFASAKHAIRPGERPKLDATLSKIREAVQRNAEISDLRLYIAGYTDTVGPADYNRKLSMRRARSIGAYFRKKGLRIPIYYQGFGKDVLAVETPDNTDEEKNRRALYLLSNHSPEIQKQFPRKDWRKL